MKSRRFLKIILAGLICTLFMYSCSEPKEQEDVLRNVVYTYGSNENGMLGCGEESFPDLPVSLYNLNDIADVDASQIHSMALSENGKVFSWGNNSNGQLGIGDSYSFIDVPIKVNGLPEIKKFCTSERISIALDYSGQVWVWGAISKTSLYRNSYVPWKTELTDIIDISCGDAFCVCVKNNGRVFAWGENSDGQLGDGTNTDRVSPVLVSGLLDIESVSAGNSHGLALSSDGKIYSWGANRYGQLGIRNETDVNYPHEIGSIGSVTDIRAGDRHSLCLLSDGSVYAWGDNSLGQLGVGDSIRSSNIPILIPSLAGIQLIDTYGVSCIALSESGLFMNWGIIPFKEEWSSYISTERVNEPQILAELSGAKKIAVGTIHYLAVMEYGHIPRE